ncbi:hypothetical protein K1719_021911 [Acacia pycnantha]|nr:hypothetical protein K1719_021911 [Acacia pycnantha]
MPLLEIIPSEKTSAQVVIDVITIGKELKKVPVVVKNCPAFAVNRTFFPYTQAAYFLVDFGIDIFKIDKCVKLSDQEIVEMVFFHVVNESCRVIDEGVVAKASDLDVASVLGMKFPSHLLTKWENMYGGFFKPSNYLAERAARGKLLSDPAPSPY